MRIADRIDRSVGDAVDELLVRHHRRRLARLGWSHAFDPARRDRPRGTDTTPPRAGNAVEILIDGRAYFERLREVLVGARSHVHVAGWHVNPEFALVRSDAPRRVTDLLAETARRVPVRILLWGGMPVPFGRTGRRAMNRIADRLSRAPGVRAVADTRDRPLHCHHEKVVVVDDEVAFVGGIDLTDLVADRFDDPGHAQRPGSQNWHDATTMLRGPVVADVAGAFAARWGDVTGERLAPPGMPKAAGDSVVQRLRTVPERLYPSVPRGAFEILEAYLRTLGSAARFVYLENQYFWSPEIGAVLEDKLRHPPSPDFRVILVLPSKPNTGADDTRGMLARLAGADTGHRFLAVTPYRYGPSPEDMSPIYVHAKVCVVDDRWMLIGSANLNEHSLFNDTEMDVLVDDTALVRDTRLRLWAEHLEAPMEEVAGDVTELFDRRWWPTAMEQGRRIEARQPLTARVVALPHVSRRSRRLLGPVESLFVDG